jgi:hypothetical protein
VQRRATYLQIKSFLLAFEKYYAKLGRLMPEAATSEPTE